MAENIKYSYFYDKFDIVHRNEPPTYSMPPHTHNAIEIYFTLTKLSNVMLGSILTPVNPDVLLIIPSYCIHQFTQDAQLSYERYVLTINTSWLDNIIDENANMQYLKDTKNPIIIPLNSEQKTHLIQNLESCISCNDTDIFYGMSRFFETMSYINTLRSYVSDNKIKPVKPKLSGKRKMVSDMIEYIDEHLYENIKIQEIADNFFISPDYASKIFKQYTNSPIGYYITIQRITRAKQFLREGNSVTETQVKTGYQSYEHFFRTFKKITGMTPKEYKTAHQN